MNYKQDLTERELLTDLLHTEKDMTKTYAGSVTESASPALRKLLIRNMTECAEDQLCVFEEMNRRNMYPTISTRSLVRNSKEFLIRASFSSSLRARGTSSGEFLE